MINTQHMTNPKPRHNVNSNARYEFTEFDLTEDEFNNLVFYGGTFNLERIQKRKQIL